MLYFNWLQQNFKNSQQSETVDCSPTSGSELFHARERCAVRHSCQMLYFFQNNVVPQFFNGMVCWHYHLQWICGYVHVYKIIKQLFHACSWNSQNYCPRCWRWLGNCCLRPQAMTCELLPSASGNDLGTVAFGLRQQFSSHLQHLGSIVLTVPWTGMK